ncbi:hypothetical protein IL306_000600 [Fusarium sp. DS 682]|nr:hypothetical protein IL306_000600 [Fusarium sp. DS 682]
MGLHKNNSKAGRDTGRDSDRARTGRGREERAEAASNALAARPPTAEKIANARALLAEADRFNETFTGNTGGEETRQTGAQGGTSSSSRRGHSGRNRGGFSGVRSRGHSYQTGSRRRVPQRSLAVATDSVLTRVADNNSRVEMQLVNHTPVDSNQNAFVQHRPQGDVWCLTPGYGVEEQIEAMKRREGCSHVIAHLHPYNKGRFDTVSEGAIEKTIEYHNGKNVHGNQALLLRGAVNPQPTRLCPACGSMNHRMATCFSKPVKGECYGCPLCDSNDHTGPDCEKLAALPLDEQVKLLITQRADMPPFTSKEGNHWWRLMHKFCMSDEHFDETLIAHAPWTRPYTKQVRHDGYDILQLQKKFDAGEGYVMPKDPAVNCMIKIAEKFWDKSNLAWPTNLGVRPPPSNAPADGDEEMKYDALAPAPTPAAPTSAADPNIHMPPQVDGEFEDRVKVKEEENEEDLINYSDSDRKDDKFKRS